jgi:hypothetical protein
MRVSTKILQCTDQIDDERDSQEFNSIPIHCRAGNNCHRHPHHRHSPQPLDFDTDSTSNDDSENDEIDGTLRD